ncbi:MAG TPA: NAD-dependent epimerase/dehydratase family protein [Ignavibacteria bacterium]|nr:NAD-dependent epimerase/dehydratase family protein [Ignavibacteria bacterium]
MQTILGSTGIIGRSLAKELTKYTKEIRLVSRNPQKVNEGDELVKADLLNKNQVLDAVKGSEVVYLTAGLKYDIKIWQSQWPVIMRNVIDACKASGSKLVFFDNVYAYGRVNGWMTEETPYKPVSKKGEVRKQIAEMLMNESGKEGFKAIIARAADFYGAGTLAFVTAMVFERFQKGKSAQWLISDKFRHSFTYAEDAAIGTAMLGNTDYAFNQIWHLPTDMNVLTGKEFVELTAREYNVKPKSMNVSKFMLKLIGLFNPIIRESVEMTYQNDSDYLFSSAKFEKAFSFKPTSYSVGIKETVGQMANSK